MLNLRIPKHEHAQPRRVHEREHRERREHRADHRAVCRSDRRDGQGNRDEASILALADGFEMLDAPSGPDLRQHARLLRAAVGRNDRRNRTPDDLIGGIAEHALRRAVPGLDDAVEVLAGDGVLRGVDDGREAERLDAVVDYSIAEWKDSIKFLEPNLTGIGGLHMAPTSMEVLGDLVVPALLSQDSTIRLQLAEDIRELLLQDLLGHLDAIGRPEGRIVLVDPKYSIDGPDEMKGVVDYYKDHYGISLLHADASELRLRGDEVYYGDEKVDLVYRDASVLDLIEMDAEGIDVAPMKALLKQNRVVSSIAAELDQKSCFEVLTDPAIAERFLTAEEQSVMRRHVLWTRIVSERRTTSPTGDQVDLLEFIRNDRESFVLKPNRSYGGEGVFVGHAVEQDLNAFVLVG